MTITSFNSYTGPPGPAGVIGVAGATGVAGVAGATGATGPAGLSGPAGAIGADGIAGPAGVAGAAGAAGVAGPRGVEGDAGPAGVAGAAGVAGVAGPVGSIGAQGPTGVQGVAGEAGVAGVSGPAGVQGAAGPAGVVGAQGVAGVAGIAGVDGVDGSIGPSGIDGAQGVAGVAGAAGPAGADGEVGPMGPAGADGAAASVGATGAAGADGVDGVDGLSPNYGFLTSERTSLEITTVVQDSTNVPDDGFWVWDDVDKSLKYTRLTTGSSNKFNFYTHDTGSINGLTIESLKSLSCEFTCVDVTSGAPRVEPKFFMAIYTPPKGDGSDLSSWYNSRIVIGGSPTDEFILSGVNYKFSSEHFVNTATRLSTTYNVFDTIMTVNVSSNSTEPAIGWVFELKSLRLFYSGARGIEGAPGSDGPVGPVGPAGPAGADGVDGTSGSSVFIGAKVHMAGLAGNLIIKPHENIPFNAESYNFGLGFDVVTNEFTVLTAGIYQISARLTTTNDASSPGGIGIFINDNYDPAYRNGRDIGSSENLITTHVATVGQRFKIQVIEGSLTIDTYPIYADFIMTRIG